MASAFLLGWANRFRKELATIGTLSLLGSLATLAVPWLVARLAGGVMGEAAGDLGQTLVMLCAALLVLTAMNIASRSSPRAHRDGSSRRCGRRRTST